MCRCARFASRLPNRRRIDDRLTKTHRCLIDSNLYLETPLSSTRVFLRSFFKDRDNNGRITFFRHCRSTDGQIEGSRRDAAIYEREGLRKRKRN